MKSNLIKISELLIRIIVISCFTSVGVGIPYELLKLVHYLGIIRITFGEVLGTYIFFLLIMGFIGIALAELVISKLFKTADTKR